jgi:hypothetical protein
MYATDINSNRTERHCQEQDPDAMIHSGVEVLWRRMSHVQDQTARWKRTVTTIICLRSVPITSKRTVHDVITKCPPPSIRQRRHASGSWIDSISPLLLFSPHLQQALLGTGVVLRRVLHPRNNTSTFLTKNWSHLPRQCVNITSLHDSESLHLCSRLLLVQNRQSACWDWSGRGDIEPPVLTLVKRLVFFTR